jgi:hypothetical protein
LRKLAAVVTPLILGRQLCSACIATKPSVTPNEIETAFATLGLVPHLHRSAHERCRACGTVGDTVLLERPSD